MVDILERITQMRTERNWTEYQLAEKSGLTQSTISSWYRKGMLPTIPSLAKICDAFEVSLSQFFLESSTDSVVLTEKQHALLSATAKLNETQYNSLVSFLESI